MHTTKTSLILVAATALVAAPATAAAPAATTVRAASLHTASYIGKGTFAVVFRTDHKLARGQNGGTIKGTVRVAGKAASSIGSVKPGATTPCYVTYLKSSQLKVGDRYKVSFEFNGRKVTRTLDLTRGTAASDRGRAQGC